MGKDNGGKEDEGLSRHMYKGHMDKAKGTWDHGWEVGMVGVWDSVGGKLRKLYVNNN